MKIHIIFVDFTVFLLALDIQKSISLLIERTNIYDYTLFFTQALLLFLIFDSNKEK